MVIERKLLTLDDVAQRMQVHEGTVRRWITDEGLPALKPGGIRVYEDELNAWLETRRIDSGGKA